MLLGEIGLARNRQLLKNAGLQAHDEYRFQKANVRVSFWAETNSRMLYADVDGVGTEACYFFIKLLDQQYEPQQSEDYVHWSLLTMEISRE